MAYIFTTADERLKFIRVKIARANEHVQDLEKRIKVFLDSEPYKVGTRPDPQFPNVKEISQHYVVSARSLTADIPVVAGEALQQMRSALDHLAWNLVEIGCARQSVVLTKTEQKQIGFPIIDTDSPTEYEAHRKRKIKGATQAAIDAIDATKPYKGGNDCLWKLNQLNNIDKHRFLVFACSQLANISLPLSLKRAILGDLAERKGHRRKKAVFTLLPILCHSLYVACSFVWPHIGHLKSG
jgi:hypothetical protein